MKRSFSVHFQPDGVNYASPNDDGIDAGCTGCNNGSGWGDAGW